MTGDRRPLRSAAASLCQSVRGAASAGDSRGCGTQLASGRERLRLRVTMIDENACVSRGASVTDVWPQVQAVLHALAYRHTTVSARFLLLPLSLASSGQRDRLVLLLRVCGFSLTCMHACMHASASSLTWWVLRIVRGRECVPARALSLPLRASGRPMLPLFTSCPHACVPLSQPVCEDWRTGDCEVGSLPAPTHHLHLHSLARSLACVG